MKNYIYPAVIKYSEEENIFTMFFPDLDLVTDGDNVEDVYSRGKKYLNRYLEIVLQEKYNLEEPSLFNSIAKEYPKDLVVLIECIINDKNKAVEQ